MRRFALVALLALTATAAQAQPLDGVWVNEAGSAVELRVGEAGRLSGAYRTELGAPDADSRFPLTGWVQGDVVAFSVRFTGFGSITSWSGQLSEDENGPFIRTLWHYTKDIPDEQEAEDLWKTINAGAATFRRADSVLLQGSD
ncbi:MAG: avidin/streptavidin family protein [Pseudomonadota bacterium]